MILVTQKKCVNCGGNIEIDENKETARCAYCGSRYIVEKPKVQPPINNQPFINNRPPVNNRPHINNQQPVYRKIPSRPKINIIVVLVLVWFYVLPAIIYIAAVIRKQQEWDRNYGSYYNDKYTNPYNNQYSDPFDRNRY